MSTPSNDSMRLVLATLWELQQMCGEFKTHMSITEIALHCGKSYSTTNNCLSMLLLRPIRRPGYNLKTKIVVRKRFYTYKRFKTPHAHFCYRANAPTF